MQNKIMLQNTTLNNYIIRLSLPQPFSKLCKSCKVTGNHLGALSKTESIS